MKALFTSLIFKATCFLFVAPVFSQSHIIGEVKDPEANSIAYANVLLLKAQDSTLVKGKLSDTEGRYQFENIAQGRYLLKIFMIGYKPAFSPAFDIVANQKLIKMDPVRLAPNAVDLKEVQVVAQKPLYELQIDRMVVNVQSSIMAAGSTALEVLERSPGI